MAGATQDKPRWRGARDEPTKRGMRKRGGEVTAEGTSGAWAEHPRRQEGPGKAVENFDQDSFISARPL